MDAITASKERAMTPYREGFTRRMTLSRTIRNTLNETLATPAARAAWLRAEAAALTREAERAKRPLETFPADPIAETF